MLYVFFNCRVVRFAVLGSGSGGNSAVVECSGKYLLIDIGLSSKQIHLRLEALGIEPESLSGILLTHEHGDHVRGLDVFSRKIDVPVYTTALTREVLSHKVESVKRWQVFERLADFDIGPFQIHAFPVQHDAVDPMGFSIQAGGSKMGFLSDVGFVTNIVREQLMECDLLAVEANYDLELLDLDEKRPWSTKQRISSRHGHLSNDQVVEFLGTVSCEKLKHVVLGHLSSDCNCPIRVTDRVNEALSRKGLSGVEIVCAEQNEVSRWIELKEQPVERPAEWGDWESTRCGSKQRQLFDI